MSGKLTWNPAVFGYTIGAKDDDLTFDKRDSAPFVPKCVGGRPEFRLAWRTAGAAACRGTTRSSTKPTSRASPSCIPRCPNICAAPTRGSASKEVIDYIRSLGVTAVELLPVHTFVDDGHLLEKGLSNYWGYNSIGFFAPDPRYAADVPNSLREFKEMVARLHDAGLEVILDVVYNHTAEGNELGPTLSFKGIDNASYYRLLPDSTRYYINDTGTGNTLNLSHPARHPDGDRQPALLGERDACRRLPLRSRHDPGARARRLRHRERLSQSGRPGPGARHASS